MEADSVKKKATPRKHVDHPPPECGAREAAAEEMPRPAVTLAKVARECGWEVAVTYARGTTDSTQPRLVHSIAVRMRRGAQVAVAAWMRTVDSGSWKFELGARLGTWRDHGTGMRGLIPVKLGSNDLKAYINSAVPVRPADIRPEVWIPTQVLAEGHEALTGLLEELVGAE